MHIFRRHSIFLQRVIQCDDGAVLQEMLHLVQVMARRSQWETAYFIKSLAAGQEN